VGGIAFVSDSVGRPPDTINTHTLFPLDKDVKEKVMSVRPLIDIKPSTYTAGKSWRFGWRNFSIALTPTIEMLTLANSSDISSTK
jgi:hypothetical protein